VMLHDCEMGSFLHAVVLWPWSNGVDLEIAFLAVVAAFAAGAAGVMAARQWHLSGCDWIAAIVGAASVGLSLGPAAMLFGWFAPVLCALASWLLCMPLAAIAAVALAFIRRTGARNA